MYLKIKLCVKSNFDNMKTNDCQCVDKNTKTSDFCTLCNLDDLNTCFFFFFSEGRRMSRRVTLTIPFFFISE